jgi:hypothetical protein
MRPELGLVEGFYGPLWPWEERAEMAEFLAGAGYARYLYAPKGDAFLRRRWRERRPAEEAARLAGFAALCARLGLRFGVGLSPHAYAGARELPLLLERARELAALGASSLALLFDDMPGGDPRLAEIQAELALRVREAFPGELSLCPTYYSDDPVLERLFGPRPAGYLEELGERLPPEIGVFWTGEKICAETQRVEHLAGVARALRRRPLLWDNYPVNDTVSMCERLHLAAFAGRPAALGEVVSAHYVNPMLQSRLSRIAARTLAESYRQGPSYDAPGAFALAARELGGLALERLLSRDLAAFRAGRGSLDAEMRARLSAEYRELAHPAASEVSRWLEGSYAVTLERIREQQ